MPAAKRDDLAIKIEIDGLRRRVGREVQDDRDRGWNTVLDGLLELTEKVVFRTDRDVADRGARHDETESMNGIARVWDEDDVARRSNRLGEIGQPFFRAESDDDLSIRVDLDPEAASIIGRASAAQTGDAARYRIAVGFWILHCFDELGDDVRRRCPIGIAHAEIDDVASGGTGLCFQRVDLGEDIRRETLDAVELFGHGSSRRVDAEV